MAIIRKSLDSIRSEKPVLDQAKIDATTEGEIREHAIEDGEDSDGPDVLRFCYSRPRRSTQARDVPVRFRPDFAYSCRHDPKLGTRLRPPRSGGAGALDNSLPRPGSSPQSASVSLMRPEGTRLRSGRLTLRFFLQISP